MSSEAVAWLAFSGFSAICAFFAGHWTSEAAWAHRTRVRELAHKEKMELIEMRRRMLEGDES